MVISTVCSADDLESTIATEKRLGKKILAVAPAQLKKLSTRSLEFTVTHYVVVTQ